MKKAISKSKYMRVPPRKARLAADLIRGMSVEQARFQLQTCQLKAGKMLQKTLKSAVANAETQLDLRSQDLKVAEVRVDPGPIIKRAKSKSRGGRAPVMKRTSHFTIIVAAE